MSYSSLLSTYLGSGLFASRPVAATIAATVPPGWVALWYATDTGALYSIVNGASAWAAVGGGAASGMGPPGMDGSDPEEPLHIPGPPGPTGPTGATGATGPAGSGSSSMGPPGMDGQDAEEPMRIPGPAGPSGAAAVASTPTVRSSSITSSSNSSYTITFPAGTIAGDLVVIFGGHGFGFNQPTGWKQLDNQAGNNFNGIALAKQMTAGDISTGSVTITTLGAFNGLIAAVTITGTTVTGIRAPFICIRSGTGTTSAELSNYSALSTDLILAFGGQRVTDTTTFTSGFTALQTVNATSASGAVGYFTGTLSKVGINEFCNFGSSGTGYYTCVIGFF